jgi:hypothetical protein
MTNPIPLRAALAATLALSLPMIATPAMAQLYNPCPYTNDGDCDEPNGLNLCAWGTDTADCSNPNSNFGGGPGYVPGSSQGQPATPGASPSSYSPWTRITNDQRQYAAQPGGVFPLMITNGMGFEPGAYVIYHGLTDGSGPTSPIWNIQAVPVTIAPDTRYIARASSWGIESFNAEGGALNMYSPPQPGRAMVYARNDDPANWRAICIIPASWPQSYCGQ